MPEIRMHRFITKVLGNMWSTQKRYLSIYMPYHSNTGNFSLIYLLGKYALLCLAFMHKILKYKANYKSNALNLSSTHQKTPKVRKVFTIVSKYSHRLYTYNCATSLEWKSTPTCINLCSTTLIPMHPPLSADGSYYPSWTNMHSHIKHSSDQAPGGCLEIIRSN